MKRLYFNFYQWIVRDILHVVPAYWYEDSRSWRESTHLYLADIKDALGNKYA